MRLSRASLETDNTSDGLLDPDSTSTAKVCQEKSVAGHISPKVVTCWLIVAFRNITFFLLSLTPPKTFKFYSSVCNIKCVDSLDLGRVLLHPSPLFCRSSHKRMSRSDRDVIWPNCGNHSRASNISTLKDLSIDKHIMVSWSRQDKTTKHH
jgi:hypothetical protein